MVGVILEGNEVRGSSWDANIIISPEVSENLKSKGKNL